MKRSLTAVLLLIIAKAVQAQIMPSDRFYVGRHFNENECRVETHPDWGDITFFTDKVFVATLFVGNSDSSFLIGRYQVRDSILHLEKIKSAIPIWYADEDLGPKDYNNLRFENIDFKIMRCKNGDIIMRQVTKKNAWYASPNRSERKYWIEQAKGIWEKIASY